MFCACGSALDTLCASTRREFDRLPIMKLEPQLEQGDGKQDEQMPSRTRPCGNVEKVLQVCCIKIETPADNSVECEKNTAELSCGCPQQSVVERDGLQSTSTQLNEHESDESGTEYPGRDHSISEDKVVESRLRPRRSINYVYADSSDDERMARNCHARIAESFCKSRQESSHQHRIEMRRRGRNSSDEDEEEEPKQRGHCYDTGNKPLRQTQQQQASHHGEGEDEPDKDVNQEDEDEDDALRRSSRHRLKPFCFRGAAQSEGAEDNSRNADRGKRQHNSDGEENEDGNRFFTERHIEVNSKPLETSKTLQSQEAFEKPSENQVSVKIFKCKICSAAFNHLNTLNLDNLFLRIKKCSDNLQVHTFKPYKCTVCNKAFRQANYLKRHKRTHSREKPYKCKYCDKAFRNKYNLMKCHQIYHTENKPYKCSDCGKTFVQLQTFNNHKLLHTASKPYVCATCGKSFNMLSSLTNHESVHTGEKPYKCRDCSKAFRNLLLLKRHQSTHNKPHKCTECDKPFRLLNELKEHQLIHTGERPHQCTICGKTFRTSLQLNIHLVIHTNEKPYKCKICFKGFAQHAALFRHQVVHTGNKKHKCPDCDKTFTQQCSVNRHQKLHCQKNVSGT